LEERAPLQRGEAEAEIRPRGLEALRAHRALAGGRIEVRAARVVGDLEPPPLIARDAVEDPLAVVDPDGEALLGEARIAGGRSEEEDLLACRPDQVAEHVREDP